MRRKFQACKIEDNEETTNKKSWLQNTIETEMIVFIANERNFEMTV